MRFSIVLARISIFRENKLQDRPSVKFCSSDAVFTLLTILKYHTSTAWHTTVTKEKEVKQDDLFKGKFIEAFNTTDKKTQLKQRQEN